MLSTLDNLSFEGGYCWIASAPAGIGPGDSLTSPLQSKLRIFEDGREIGPGHSLHTEIRTAGRGRFSHWGDYVYFSTSDNTNPNENGRSYLVNSPSPEEELYQLNAFAAAFATDHTLVRTALSKSLATQGSVFYSVFSVRALLKALLSLPCQKLNMLTFLEIGASPTLGLPLALALCGAKKVIVNNIAPINATVSEDFVRCLQVLLNLQDRVERDWREVVTSSETAGMVQVNPEIIQILGAMDAAAIPSSAGPADVVFSISVLEHIRHLPGVLRKTRGLMSEEAVFFHWIDLRDHTDFADPLKYLRLSQAAFDAAYSTEHNRWRAHHYLSMFKEAGLKVTKCCYSGALPASTHDGTDVWSVIENGGATCYYDTPQEIPLKISETERALLAPEFSSLPVDELSIMVMQVFGCRN